MQNLGHRSLKIRHVRKQYQEQLRKPHVFGRSAKSMLRQLFIL
jgi:hypothetical protein